MERTLIDFIVKNRAFFLLFVTVISGALIGEITRHWSEQPREPKVLLANVLSTSFLAYIMSVVINEYLGFYIAVGFAGIVGFAKHHVAKKLSIGILVLILSGGIKEHIKRGLRKWLYQEGNDV